MIHRSLGAGARNRVVDSTDMNQASSRSHLVCVLTVKASPVGKNGSAAERFGRLYMVGEMRCCLGTCPFYFDRKPLPTNHTLTCVCDWALDLKDPIEKIMKFAFRQCQVTGSCPLSRAHFLIYAIIFSPGLDACSLYAIMPAECWTSECWSLGEPKPLLFHSMSRCSLCHDVQHACSHETS